MAWVKNRRDSNFQNHWYVVDDNGKNIEGPFEGREAAEKACAGINAPETVEKAPQRRAPKAKRAKKK